MKKKLIMSIATLSLALSMSVQVFADPLVVNINGVNRVFTQAIDEEGVITVNAEELADKLNLEYTYNYITGAVSFKSNDQTLNLQINSNLGTLNDVSVQLPATTKLIDGEIFVPLEFISDTFGAELAERDDEIVTDFDEPYFSDLSGIDDVTAETTVYTYDAAVELAMENSSAAKMLDVQYDATKDGIETIDESIAAGQEFMNQNPGFPIDSEAYYDLLSTKYDLTLSLDLTGEQKDLVETGIELSLITALNTLDTAKMNYELTSQTLALQEQDLDVTRVKHDLGLVSDYTLQKASSTIENTKTNLNILENQIISAKQEINAILGLPLDSDIYIENDIQIKEKEYDLNKLVKDAKSQSLAVKDAQQKLEDEMRTTYPEATSYQIAKINVDQMRKTVEKEVYDDYTALQAIVENDKVLNNNRDMAIADYNMAVEQYKVGYITKYTLDQMLLNIANIDASILKNEMNYQLLTFKMDNPSLYGISAQNK